MIMYQIMKDVDVKRIKMMMMTTKINLKYVKKSKKQIQIHFLVMLV